MRCQPLAFRPSFSRPRFPWRTMALPGAVLDRAVAAMGGHAALDAVRELRIVYVGTLDLRAVYQGRFAEEPSPERRQETLILDVSGRRGAMRTEGVQSDGTPSLWRDTILPGGGYIDQSEDAAHDRALA